MTTDKHHGCQVTACIHGNLVCSGIGSSLKNPSFFRFISFRQLERRFCWASLWHSEAESERIVCQEVRDTISTPYVKYTKHRALVNPCQQLLRVEWMDNLIHVFSAFIFSLARFSCILMASHSSVKGDPACCDIDLLSGGSWWQNSHCTVRKQ